MWPSLLISFLVVTRPIDCLIFKPFLMPEQRVGTAFPAHEKRFISANYYFNSILVSRAWEVLRATSLVNRGLQAILPLLR